MSTRRPRVPVPVEPAPIDPEPAAANPDAEVEVEPVALFTPEQIKQDGVNAVSRTGVQLFGGVNVIALVTYLFERYLPSHLPPALVLVEAVGLVGVGFAYLMNRRRIHHGRI